MCRGADRLDLGSGTGGSPRGDRLASQGNAIFSLNLCSKVTEICWNQNITPSLETHPWGSDALQLGRATEGRGGPA